jgi:type I restriction enzyme S subunit
MNLRVESESSLESCFVTEWAITTLGAFAPLSYGKALPDNKRAGSGGVGVYGSNGRVGEHNLAYVPSPGVVVGRKGSVGEVHFAPGPFWPIDTTFFIVSAPHRDLRFTYYLLKWLDLRHMNSDSAIPGLNREAAHARTFRVPPLPVQRAIGEVLGALDDKIESNNRLAADAQELILTAVRASESAAWATESVSSLARFVNGGAYTNGATGTGRMVIRIAELNGGPGASTVYNDLVVPDDKLARAGDLLMSWSGSLGVFRWVRDEAIINQHIFKVICTTYPHWLVFAKLLEVLPEFRQIAADKATTMGHIKRHHLDDALVRMPRQEEVVSLDAQLGPLWKRLVVAEAENLALADLRDALLPQLFSERLRIPASALVVEGIA